MCEATPESVAWNVRHSLVGEWAALIRAGGLTTEGLVFLRSRLADSGEFAGSPHAAALLLHVITRLSAARGIEPEDDDLWATVVPPIPDTPEGIDEPPPPPPSRW